MRHASVNATLAIFEWQKPPRPNVHDRRACDWAHAGPKELMMVDSTAFALLAGERVELPTCPACAALVDLALEMRGS